MNVPPGGSVVLVRYGDISTKSDRVRRMMEDKLVANLEDGLNRAGIEASVEREWTRPIVVTDTDRVEAATEVAASTIGVVSASPSRRLNPRRNAIIDALVETAHRHYDGGSFAIRARRADKQLPFTSADIEREAGSAVYEAAAERFEPEVDLEDPDVTLHVEIRPEHAYVFVDSVDGPGGLPVGSQSPMVALISGGIDSPVAAYRAMRRGSPIIPVYVDLGAFGGPDHQARALEAIARLDTFAGVERRPTYLVPGGEAVSRFVETVERGRMLVLRRFMFRVADRIAAKDGAVGIVTGEALGQKSSQTAANLLATSVVTERPIHRPLLSLDKVEVTDEARSLGTYRSATLPAGCPSVAPDQVETRATPEEIDELEPSDVDDLVERAVAEAAIVEPTRLDTYGGIATVDS